MYKLKIYDDGFEDYENETFETREEALDFMSQIESERSAGAEDLFLSNPGDYPYDDDDDGLEFDIIRI